MHYRENPKTAGSGIICCIPQTGICSNKCPDCFFQSGRSYLEPLAENLPNMPPVEMTIGKVVRVNDGNDSNIDRDLVIESTKPYKDKFYNTAIPQLNFPAPVVLTINPKDMTDTDFYKIDPIPKNLMFVRFRTNEWNYELRNKAVAYYSQREVPIVLTFMAYFKESLPRHVEGYIFRKRTLNYYWAICTEMWREIMDQHKNNKWVYSCGRIEGELGDPHCRFCWNCLRDYFNCMERLGKSNGKNVAL